MEFSLTHQIGLETDTRICLLIAVLAISLIPASWSLVPEETKTQSDARQDLRAEPIETCGRRPAFRISSELKLREQLRTIEHNDRTRIKFINETALNESAIPKYVAYPAVNQNYILINKDPRNLTYIDLQSYDNFIDSDEDDDNDEVSEQKTETDEDDERIEDQQNILVPLIVGGYDAEPGQFPSYVKIIMGDWVLPNEVTPCGGVLIGPRTVLGAAHCKAMMLSSESIRVVVGLNSPGRSRERTYLVKRVCHQEEHCLYREVYTFKGREKINYLPMYDLLIIELAEKVAYNDFVQPACIAYGLESFYRPKSRDVYEAVGLGKFSDRNVAPNKIQFTRFRRYCESKKELRQYRKTGAPIQCYTGVRGSHTCMGDSGGPIYYQRREGKTGQRLQFVSGIVSFGTSVCRLVDKIEGYAVDLMANEESVPEMVNRCVARLPSFMDSYKSEDCEQILKSS